MLNPHPIHWSDIFDMVADAGYPVRKLPFNEWVEAIEEHADPDSNPLYPLLPFFHIDFARRMLGVSESHFQALGTAATRQALANSGLRCPEMNSDLVRTFLAQLVRLGHLQPTSKVSVVEMLANAPA